LWLAGLVADGISFLVRWPKLQLFSLYLSLQKVFASSNKIRLGRLSSTSTAAPDYQTRRLEFEPQPIHVLLR